MGVSKFWLFPIAVMVLASLINVNTIGNGSGAVYQYKTSTSFDNPTSCSTQVWNLLTTNLPFQIATFVTLGIGAPTAYYLACLAGQQVATKMTDFFISFSVNGGGNTPDSQGLGFLIIEVTIVTIAVVAGVQLVSSGLSPISIYVLLMSGFSIALWLTLSAINFNFFYPPSSAFIDVNTNVTAMPYGSLIYMLLTLSYLIGSIELIRIG